MLWDALFGARTPAPIQFQLSSFFMPYYVAVHGGAGFFHTETEKEVRKAMRRACAKALAQLQEGKKACEAVETAIVELEDSECLNAGYGSNLTQEGTVECDAAIMDESGDFGSVGAISGVRNPIRVAKAILDYSTTMDLLGRVPPLTLVSSGARDFALTSKITTVHSDLMVSPRAREEWKFWRDKGKGRLAGDTGHSESSSRNLVQDTVGCVALDVSGKLAAGVSSGGLLLKLPGRVGEAAVFGAGCWAQSSHVNKGVATSVSGTGEAIVRVSLARTLSDVVSRDEAHEELRHILANEFPRVRTWPAGQTSSAGAVILSKEARDDGTIAPRLWCAFNTASMAVAYASSDAPRPTSLILRQPESCSSASDVKAVYLTVLPWNTT